MRTEVPRAFSGAEIDLLMAIAGQVAQAIENAKLYEAAQQRVAELEALASISEAVSESLYLEESLEAIVKRTMEAVGATGPPLCSKTAPWPGPKVALASTQSASRCAGGAARSESSSATGTRRSPTRRSGCSRRSPITLRWPWSMDAPSCAGSSPRRSTTASRTTCRRWLRYFASRPGRAPQSPTRRSSDSVNRILAIAAVHEVLTERRDEDVDLGELVERLRAMLVQGLGGGKRVESQVEPILLHGGRATALALIFSELLQNALEHGGNEVQRRARPGQRPAYA